MYTTIITTILALTSSALSAAIPDAVAARATGSVDYCAAPGICATIPITNEECHTLAEPFPLLTVSAGLKCTVYSNPDCTKAFASIYGKVQGVTGTFDASKNTKNGVKSVGSFFCS